MTPQRDQWSTTHLPPAAQFAAWRDAVVDAHLAWDIPGVPCASFPAYMHQHRVDAMRVTDCSTAAPVRGTRAAAQIAQDDAAYLNVVLIADGVEALRFGPREADVVELHAGMFTLWDSTRPMAFATSAQLRQISLIVPEGHLLRRVPRVRDLIGKPIDGRQGVGGLFVDHLCALVQRLPDLSMQARPAVLDGTLDLLALCLGEQPSLPAPRLRQALLEQVQRHVEAHLTDTTLGVAALAQRFRMTERNLHKLFEGSGDTVCGHIRRRRLAMCRRDLACPLLANRQVTEIAGHWGFHDPSQFSKLFRAAFGMSASELRAQARSLAHHSPGSG